MIHVCSLARLHATVEETGASHIVTLLGAESRVACPEGIAPDNHLYLHVHDIAAPLEGHICPAEEHLEQLIAFVQRWERTAPMVVHCFAGISRSTASAYTAVCALNPQRDEKEIALRLRRASPTATPNVRIVAMADAMLGRKGRMIAAIESIGRGVEAVEGIPFRLDLD